MTIAKVLAVYKTSPIVLVVESVESTVCDLSLTDLHAGAIGLVTGRGGASSRSIGCLPANLRQASTGRPTAIGLALPPGDGVPIGAAPVRWRHIAGWEEASQAET